MRPSERVTISEDLIGKLKELNKQGKGVTPLTGEFAIDGLTLDGVAESKQNIGIYAPVALHQLYGKGNIGIQLRESQWICFSLEKVPTGKAHRLTIPYCNLDDY